MGAQGAPLKTAIATAVGERGGSRLELGKVAVAPSSTTTIHVIRTCAWYKVHALSLRWRGFACVRDRWNPVPPLHRRELICDAFELKSFASQNTLTLEYHGGPDKHPEGMFRLVGSMLDGPASGLFQELGSFTCFPSQHAPLRIR